MQFCQPGYAYPGIPPPYNMPYLFNGCPEIVGEGNVASLNSPDGSVQLVFIPTLNWFKQLPCPVNYNCFPNNTPNINPVIPTKAWFIRSILCPLQPTIYHPQQYSQPCPATCNSVSNLNIANQSRQRFELKFHNDTSTSTSDIQYFYPNLRTCQSLYCAPRTCPSIQLVVPPKPASVDEATNVKTCNFSSKEAAFRIRSGSQSSSSQMSCDVVRECCCNKKNKKSKNNKKVKRFNVKSECKADNVLDKGVATFTDQGNGCSVSGCETQTVPVKVCNNQTSGFDLVKKEHYRPAPTKGGKTKYHDYCSCSTDSEF